MQRFTTALTSFSVVSLWANSAFALCLPIIGCIGDDGGGGGTAVPEIDGPGGVAAIALLVSIGAVLYRKYR